MNNTILIVEDDKSIADIISVFLSQEGYLVDIASQGKIALEKISNNLYDLILLDYMLPDINGLKIINEALKIRSDLNVVLHSSYSEKKEVTDQFKDKVKGIIEKPCNCECFLGKIKEFISNKKELS
jgi:DNA-binding response OmpR family regulator